MRKRWDIILGLLAWAVALSGLLWKPVSGSPPPFILGGILIPALCLVCLLLMGLFRTRPCKKLFWAWLAAPASFARWLIGLYVFLVWTFRGFAP